MRLRRDGQLYELQEDEREWVLQKLPANKAGLAIPIIIIIIGIWFLNTAIITFGVMWFLYAFVYPKKKYIFSKSEYQMQQDGNNIIFVSKKKKYKFKIMS